MLKHMFYTAVTLAMASPAVAQIVHADDVVINGAGADDQLCVGDNCSNTEVFTDNKIKIRIKDEDVALQFQDISVNATDWNIEANQLATDSLRIRNDTTAASPFVVMSGATSNALYVGNQNRIGLGTSLPQRNVHLVTFAQPVIRMEYTENGGGYTDIGRGTLAFVIGDADTDVFPFYMENGAPDDSLHIQDSGDIGFGVSSPNAPLHIRETQGLSRDMLLLENNGPVVFRLSDTSASGQQYTFQSNGGLFRIASPAVPGPEFTMDDFGNVTIKGEITTAGSCSSGCDRVFDAGYDLPDMADHHARMWQLGHLPNVGPTDEGSPINLSAKMGGILNELEHAHIFIQQQQEQIEHQAALIEEMQVTHVAQITELTARLNRLEASK